MSILKYVYVKVINFIFSQAFIEFHNCYCIIIIIFNGTLFYYIKTKKKKQFRLKGTFKNVVQFDI